MAIAIFFLTSKLLIIFLQDLISSDQIKLAGEVVMFCIFQGMFDFFLFFNYMCDCSFLIDCVFVRCSGKTVKAFGAF
jgi:hypothetical protein